MSQQTTLRPSQMVADPSRPTQSRETKFFRRSLFRSLTAMRGSRDTHGAMTTIPPHHSPRRSHHFRSFRCRHLKSPKPVPEASNVMHWLEDQCPPDLIPKVLAFVGPQQMTTIYGVSTFWRDLLEEESTWRTLCEELYKWKEGDATPESWREFYQYNPCVPIDYATISDALSIVRGPRYHQTRCIRVLLRPGRYIQKEAITVQAPSAVQVVIETMQLPDSYLPVDQTSLEDVEDPNSNRKSKNRLMKMLDCRRMDVEDPNEELSPPEFMESPSSTSLSTMSSSHPAAYLSSAKRATLIMRSRRLNEPVVFVRQGSAVLRNLEIRHISHGADIWNGNAAIQIQPLNGPDNRPMMVLPAPTASLDHVEITSASGRGIVNIDGGRVSIKNCYVHDCAATGIYVGGPGSWAEVERTDVVRNGNGNTHNRRGIARGHSGVYLEQGRARISDCNISQNFLTGLSAVSPDNAILDLEESELISNGALQLEMPPPGSVARRSSSTRNNTVAQSGLPRSRSGLLVES